MTHSDECAYATVYQRSQTLRANRSWLISLSLSPNEPIAFMIRATDIRLLCENWGAKNSSLDKNMLRHSAWKMAFHMKNGYRIQNFWRQCISKTKKMWCYLFKTALLWFQIEILSAKWNNCKLYFINQINSINILKLLLIIFFLIESRPMKISIKCKRE